MPLFGPPNVEMLKAKGDIKGLVKALNYQKEAYIRETAAMALGSLKAIQALEPLLAALGDPNPSVRKAAVHALGTLGDRRAVESLTTLVRDESENVRKEAVWALGGLQDERAIAPLIAALQEESLGVRLAAATALGQIGSPDGVQSLFEAWQRSGERALKVVPGKAVGTIRDHEEYTAACEEQRQIGVVLGRVHTLEVIDSLVALLADGEELRRQVAADVLAHIGPPAVEALISTLGHQNNKVRQLAAETLGSIGNRQAIEPLTPMLYDVDRQVRQAAAAALDRLGWQPGQDATGAGYWAAKKDWSRCLEIGPSGLEVLLLGLVDEPDRQVRRMVAGQVREMGSAAVGPLSIALQNQHPTVRTWAASSLGGIGDTQAVEPLVAALRDESDNVRKAAARSLGNIGAPRAVEPLVTALDDTPIANTVAWALLQIDEVATDTRQRAIARLGTTMLQSRDPAIRRTIAIELGKTGEEQAIEHLVTLLHPGSELGEWSRFDFAHVHLAATEALDRLGWQPGQDADGAAYWIARREWERCIEIGEPAVEPLFLAMWTGDHDAQQRAAESLAKIGTPSVALLIETLQEKAWDPNLIANILAKIGKPAVEPLITLLRQGESNIRQATVQVLGKIGDPRAVAPLLDLLQDNDPVVRQNVVQALGQIGDPQAIGPLLSALQDKDPAVRQTTVQVLGKIGDPWAVAPLLDLLQDNNPVVRQTVVQALGQIGDPQTVGPLLDALQDKNLYMREAAANSLANLYQSGQLDETQRAQILALKGKSLGHRHHDSHWDSWSQAYCPEHSDRRCSEKITIKFEI